MQLSDKQHPKVLYQLPNGTANVHSVVHVEGVVHDTVFTLIAELVLLRTEYQYTSVRTLNTDPTVELAAAHASLSEEPIETVVPLTVATTDVTFVVAVGAQHITILFVFIRAILKVGEVAAVTTVGVP